MASTGLDDHQRDPALSLNARRWHTCPRRSVAALVFACLALTACTHQNEPVATDAWPPADQYLAQHPRTFTDISDSSLYLTMRDGVRIAIEVLLPAKLKPGERIPTILRQTRYWRET